MNTIVTTIDWRHQKPGINEFDGYTLNLIQSDLLSLAITRNMIQKARVVALFDDCPQMFLDLPSTPSGIIELLSISGMASNRFAVGALPKMNGHEFAVDYLKSVLNEIAGKYGVGVDELSLGQEERRQVAARLIPYIGAGVLASLLMGRGRKAAQTILIGAEFPMICSTDSFTPLRMSGRILRALVDGKGNEVENSGVESALLNEASESMNLPRSTFLQKLPAVDSVLARTLGPNARYGFVCGKSGACGFYAELGHLLVAFLDLTDPTTGFGSERQYSPDKLRRTIFESLGLPNFSPVATQQAEVDDSVEVATLHEANAAKEDIEKHLGFIGKSNPLVGKSSAIVLLYPSIRQAICNRKLNVIVFGEVGTGKEVLCELLARFDEKTDNNPVFVEASELSSNPNLAASRLFGIGKGVATGVDESRGYIEEATDGTLVLDGMEYAATFLQQMLRRVFDPDRRKYGIPGVPGEKNVRCRMVMTFNIPPKQLVENGSLIPDIPSRVQIQLTIPPLRERKEDIPLIVHALVERRIDELGLKSKVTVNHVMPPQSRIDEWSRREWKVPGRENVRGLRHEVYEYVEHRCGELGVLSTLAQHTSNLLLSWGRELPPELATDTSPLQHDGKMNKRGRPKLPDIDDEVLAGLMQEFEENPTMPAKRLFDQILLHKKIRRKNLGRSGDPVQVDTSGSLIRRIQKISPAIISNKWPDCDPREKKAAMTKLVKDRCLREGIPHSRGKKIQKADR